MYEYCLEETKVQETLIVNGLIDRMCQQFFKPRNIKNDQYINLIEEICSLYYKCIDNQSFEQFKATTIIQLVLFVGTVFPFD